MKSHITGRFRELFAALPTNIQRQARESDRLFLQSPSYPGLQFKQVCSDPLLYSARVGMGYRVVGVRDGGTVIWFWIGTHADYDQLLSRL